MADWKKNRLKYQMAKDAAQQADNYAKRKRKAIARQEAARKAAFEKLLLERWQARQEAKRHDGV